MSSLGQESAAESQRVTGTGLEPGGRPPRPFSEPQFLVGSKSTGSGSRHTADPTPYLPETSARHHQLCGPLFPHLKNGGDPAFLAGHCEDSSLLAFPHLGFSEKTGKAFQRACTPAGQTLKGKLVPKHPKEQGLAQVLNESCWSKPHHTPPRADAEDVTATSSPFPVPSQAGSETELLPPFFAFPL